MHGTSIRLLVTAVLSLLLVGVLPSQAAAGETFVMRVPMLMYHRITCAPSDSTSLWVCPSRFEAHLRLLRSEGWRTITADRLAREFAARREIGPKRLVISIDDGMVDGYTTAHPILMELGMRATYYVNPGKVRDSGPAWRISFDQMRELEAAGHDVANHSLEHRDVSQLSGDALTKEVERAQVILERELGHRSRTFCYPLGRYDREARRMVRKSGHTLAFTTEYGAYESTSRPMRAPRIRIQGWDDAADVLAKVAPYASGQ
jgi:peptidoglycan/xylan/chitin deacetylase (PgdA/CDA1 family)